MNPLKNGGKDEPKIILLGKQRLNYYTKSVISLCHNLKIADDTVMDTMIYLYNIG